MSVAADDWTGVEVAHRRYQIVKKIGEGGMGRVYRAYDSHLETDVVIKAPRKEMLEDEDAAHRFAREVRSLIRLSHPHVVKVSDVGEHQGLPFVVMQYLSGGSLEDWLHALHARPDSHGATNLSECAWLPHIAEALDFIHGQGYVHRDVKPANILFDEHGHAYLGDFGIVRAFGDQQRAQTIALTGAGMALGTPEYMAPEVIAGKEYDGRADQYALAIVVYELLSGHPPFHGSTGPAIFMEHINERPRRLHTLRKDVSGMISNAVTKGLSKEPKRRFLSCREFLDVLLGVKATSNDTRPVSASAHQTKALSAPEDSEQSRDAQEVVDEWVNEKLHTSGEKLLSRWKALLARFPNSFQRRLDRFSTVESVQSICMVGAISVLALLVCFGAFYFISGMNTKADGLLQDQREKPNRGRRRRPGGRVRRSTPIPQSQPSPPRNPTKSLLPIPKNASDALEDLRSNDGARRETALAWLSSQNPAGDDDMRPDVSAELVELLNDDELRKDALKGLKKWGDKESIPMVIDQVEKAKKGSSIRATALETLAEIGDESTIGLWTRILEKSIRKADADITRAELALKRFEKSAENDVLQLLNSPNPFTRTAALRLLKEYETEQGALLAQCVKDLRSDSPDRKRAAVEYLSTVEPGRSHRDEIALALEHGLQQKNSLVRDRIAKAITKWVAPVNRNGLTKLLKHEDRETRLAALKALANLNDPSMAASIAEALVDTFMRRQAAEILQKMGPAAEKAVVDYLMHSDRNVRREAIQILSRIGTRTYLHTLARLAKDSSDPSTQSVARQALSEIVQLGRISKPKMRTWTGARGKTKIEAAFLTYGWKEKKCWFRKGNGDKIFAFISSLSSIDKKYISDELALRDWLIEISEQSNDVRTSQAAGKALANLEDPGLPERRSYIVSWTKKKNLAKLKQIEFQLRTCEVNHPNMEMAIEKSANESLEKLGLKSTIVGSEVDAILQVSITTIEKDKVLHVVMDGKLVCQGKNKGLSVWQRRVPIGRLALRFRKEQIVHGSYRELSQGAKREFFKRFINDYRAAVKAAEGR